MGLQQRQGMPGFQLLNVGIVPFGSIKPDMLSLNMILCFMTTLFSNNNPGSNCHWKQHQFTSWSKDHMLSGSQKNNYRINYKNNMTLIPGISPGITVYQSMLIKGFLPQILHGCPALMLNPEISILRLMQAYSKVQQIHNNNNSFSPQFILLDPILYSLNTHPWICRKQKYC